MVVQHSSHIFSWIDVWFLIYTAMINIKNFVIECVDGVHEKFFPIVEDMSGIVGGIVAIATIFYIGSKVWSSYAKNEPIDVYPLLRPFVIAFLCANFTTLVCTPIDNIIEPVTIFLKEKSNSTIVMSLDEAQKKIEAEKDKQKAQNGGSLNIFSDLLSVMLKLICWILEIIVQLLQMLLSAVLIVSRTFFLSVLCIIGPIAFAVSLFPGCQGGLMQWIGKYVSISFWLPVIYLVDLFCGIFNKEIVTACVDFFANPVTAGNGQVEIIIIIILVSCVTCIVTYFCYTTVPTVSSWVITGGDTNGIQGMLGASTMLGMGTSLIGGMMGRNAVNKSAAAQKDLLGSMSDTLKEMADMQKQSLGTSKGKGKGKK